MEPDHLQKRLADIKALKTRIGIREKEFVFFQYRIVDLLKAAADVSNTLQEFLEHADLVAGKMGTREEDVKHINFLVKHLKSQHAFIAVLLEVILLHNGQS